MSDNHLTASIADFECLASCVASMVKINDFKKENRSYCVEECPFGYYVAGGFC